MGSNMIQRHPMVIYEGVCGFVVGQSKDHGSPNLDDIFQIKTLHEKVWLRKSQFIFVGSAETDADHLRLFNTIMGVNWTFNPPIGVKDGTMFWYDDANLSEAMPVIIWNGFIHILGSSGSTQHERVEKANGLWLRIDPITAHPKMEL